MDKLAEVFKALGDPTRLKIVKMLAENGEMCVCRFVEDLGMGQSAVSHHMAALRHAGLLLSRKKGQWIYYRLDQQAFQEGPSSFLQDLLEKASAVVPEQDKVGCCG